MNASYFPDTQMKEDAELEAYECPHEFEHLDHLEAVADNYRKELFVCILCNKTKVVVKPFGVKD